MLLQHGASPHNTNSRNESPLLIAVRQGSYNMVLSLIMGGAFVEQVCLSKWTATHEAAKVGCPAILMLLLRHGAKVTTRDGHGVTPLGIAAEHGNTEALDILIEHGGDVNAQASNGDTVLYDAAGSGNLDSVELLLQHGANPSVASYAFQLPIHRAAYEGHVLVLKTLIPITTKRAIRLSGQDPIHSAADGGQVECLELLIQKGHDVNALLGTHISENYGDLRKSPLYFAISNGYTTCAEKLLEAGARTDLDPLQCILVAIRAERYELVQLLLSVWSRCELLLQIDHQHSVPHSSAVLPDGPCHAADCCSTVDIKLTRKPRSLQHLCRLVIRDHMQLRTLNDPKAMAAVPFPPRLKNYVTYRDFDLYGHLSLT
ncbi:Ankyrin repeat and SOCS box protein 15 [Larimichthys crocea]|uniref:Uncharacterized protein n=1 Tax=Larimichthys crocea TaxID=215358 RepID=A0ACD3Q883_LARCR|nr:Ankyrin repeat and SOCS box protein 15 [Larimichthys crocea]